MVLAHEQAEKGDALEYTYSWEGVGPLGVNCTKKDSATIKMSFNATANAVYYSMDS